MALITWSNSSIIQSTSHKGRREPFCESEAQTARLRSLHTFAPAISSSIPNFPTPPSHSKHACNEATRVGHKKRGYGNEVWLTRNASIRQLEDSSRDNHCNRRRHQWRPTQNISTYIHTYIHTYILDECFGAAIQALHVFDSLSLQDNNYICT